MATIDKSSSSSSLSDGRFFDPDSATFSSGPSTKPDDTGSSTSVSSMTTTATTVASKASPIIQVSLKPVQGNTGFTVTYDPATDKILAKKGARTYEVEVVNSDITTLIKKDGSEKTELYELIKKVADFLDDNALLNQSASVSIGEQGLDNTSFRTDGRKLGAIETGKVANSIAGTKTEFQQEYHKLLLNPLNPFISNSLISKLYPLKMENSSNGDCGPESISQQLNQMGIKDISKTVRTKCANHLVGIAQKIKEKRELSEQDKLIIEQVYDCLKVEKERLQDINLTGTSEQIKKADLITIFEIADKTPNDEDDSNVVHKLSPEEQQKLLSYRAECFYTDRMWVTDDFFEVSAAVYRKNIVILLEDENRVPYIKKIYPTLLCNKIEFGNALYIYSNAKLNNKGTSNNCNKFEAGTHFQSIKRVDKPIDLLPLVIERHVRSLIDNFIYSIKNNPQSLITRELSLLPLEVQEAVEKLLAIDKDWRHLTAYAITKKMNESFDEDTHEYMLDYSKVQLQKIPKSKSAPSSSISSTTSSSSRAREKSSAKKPSSSTTPSSSASNDLDKDLKALENLRNTLQTHASKIESPDALKEVNLALNNFTTLGKNGLQNLLNTGGGGSYLLPEKFNDSNDETYRHLYTLSYFHLKDDQFRDAINKLTKLPMSSPTNSSTPISSHKPRFSSLDPTSSSLSH